MCHRRHGESLIHATATAFQSNEGATSLKVLANSNPV